MHCLYKKTQQSVLISQVVKGLLLLKRKIGVFMRWFIFFLFFMSFQFSWAMVEKFRLMVRENATNEITIGWNQVSGANPVVYYDTEDHGTDYVSYAFQQSEDRQVSYAGMDNRFVRLSNLTPNTAYYFVIRDSEGAMSPRLWFRTAPNDVNAQISVVSGGDSRNNRIPRVNANKIVAKLRPTVIMFGGDMTSSGTDENWDEWFDDWQATIADDGFMAPVIATRGNHEGHNEVVYNLFDLPSSDNYYAVDVVPGLLRVYTLNTEMTIAGAQTQWLASDLATSRNVVWKFAQYHRPMRPHNSSKGDASDAYYNWASLFYDEGVRIIFESDAHTVKNTWPIRPSSEAGNDEGFIRDDLAGSVYAGEGCWGAPTRSNDDDKTWTRNSGQFNQVKWSIINKNTVELRTIKTDNADLVGSVSDDDIFTAPANLDVWSPSNGSVITIASVGVAPSIELTTPVAEEYYSTPQQITLSANASDVDGSVAQVEFFVEGVSVGSSFYFPYSVNWNIPATGTYNIHAVATDSDGNTNVSATHRIAVGVINYSYDIVVNGGEGDGEEGSDGVPSFSSSDLELVTDNDVQTIGLRFSALDLAQGVEVSNAYIQFTTDETGSDPTILDIQAVAEDDCEAFNRDANNISGRARTMALVEWTPESWNTIGERGEPQRTPELKELVQEVVNRPAWQANNSMCFIIDGSGKRVASAYDSDPALAPSLHVEYALGGTPVSSSSDLGISSSSDSPVSTEIILQRRVEPLQFELHNGKLEVTSAADEWVNLQLYDSRGRLLGFEMRELRGKTKIFEQSWLGDGIYVVQVRSELRRESYQIRAK
jgi:hypothetical protein